MSLLINIRVCNEETFELKSDDNASAGDPLIMIMIMMTLVTSAMLFSAALVALHSSPETRWVAGQSFETSFQASLVLPSACV